MSDERHAEPGLAPAVVTEEDRVAMRVWIRSARVLGLAVVAWLVLLAGVGIGTAFLAVAVITPAR